MCTSRFGATHPWSNILHENHAEPLKEAFPNLRSKMIDEIVASAVKNTLVDVTGIIAILASADAYQQSMQRPKSIPSVQFSFWELHDMYGARYEIDEVQFIEEKFRDIQMAEKLYQEIKAILGRHMGITLVSQCTCSFKPIKIGEEDEFTNSPDYKEMQFVRQFLERHPSSKTYEATMATIPKRGLLATSDEIQLMNKIISIMDFFLGNHLMKFDEGRARQFEEYKQKLEKHLQTQKLMVTM
jgi:hypothetical protein